ncbi:MAG: hypothetical protein K6B70_05930 [Clostridia bacterium]|nr:hypothetical protein [Clostridia bacterium]
MEKNTNEKSLMVVQDGFLKKVKNFFVRFFWSKTEDVQYDEVDDKEINNKKIDITREPEVKERKLYNFDADNNDEWPENASIPSQTEEQNVQENNDENEQDSEYETEQMSEVCREKEELEQKLRNYYASITKMNN